MTRLAARTGRMASSPTMKVTATVDRLRREGVAVIDFGTGEPDFATPSPIGAAAHTAIDQDFTKYTPVGGIQSLKQAVCDRYRADYGVDYAPSNVILSAGGKQALFNTALSLFGPGDEVILHQPCWPTLPEQVKLAEAEPVFVRTTAENGFAITAAPFLKTITPRTRGIIINSPCNPTGALIDESQLTILARAALARGIWLVIDLCYEKLIFDAADAAAHNLPRVLARECPELSVICGSASKAYAMTGWRCGWTIGPAALVAAEHAIQSHATSNVASITQKAALEALTGPQSAVTEMLDAYRRRRDNLMAWLTGHPAYRAAVPRGTFYLFLDVTRMLSADGFRTSNDFAQALLDEQRVAVTPGEAFDAPGFVRISFATSIENLREGSDRMIAFAARHAGPLAVG